jgi:hypothetical protein
MDYTCTKMKQIGICLILSLAWIPQASADDLIEDTTQRKTFAFEHQINHEEASTIDIQSGDPEDVEGKIGKSDNLKDAELEVKSDRGIQTSSVENPSKSDARKEWDRKKIAEVLAKDRARQETLNRNKKKQ